MAGHAAQDEQVREHVDDVGPLQLAADPDREALVGELVHHVEHPDLSPIMGAVLDEVVGPDVVAVLRPKPDARSVSEPEPPPLRLSGRHLEPFTPPDPLDPLVVDEPAGLSQKRADLPIAVATVLSRQLDEVGRERLIVIAAPRRNFRLSCRIALRFGGIV